MGGICGVVIRYFIARIKHKRFNIFILSELLSRAVVTGNIPPAFVKFLARKFSQKKFVQTIFCHNRAQVKHYKTSSLFSGGTRVLSSFIIAKYFLNISLSSFLFQLLFSGSVEIPFGLK